MADSGSNSETRSSSKPAGHNNWLGKVSVLPILCGLAVLSLWLLLPAKDALVVYCAHDAAYSKAVLDEFTKETGIEVSVRFDTEATKSLGLVNLLISEKENPRCDVFWNNQVLGTAKLQAAGVLQSYKGDGWNRIPNEFKDADGFWTGFAGRLRVIIYNTDLLAVEDVDQKLTGDLSQFAFAKPIYGTTLTHFSVMYRDLGPEQLKQFHTDIRKRGATMVAGNSAVKSLVANGACEFGWTDTDDFFVAVDNGKPVAMLPIKTDDGSTICIPNSIAMIKGTQREEQAKTLIDFLLSKQNELRLASSKSRQIPLGNDVTTKEVPDEVRELVEWAKPGIQYDKPLLKAHAECLDWLSAEYLQ